MQNLIEVIDRNLIKQELTRDKFLRKTTFGARDVYVITAHDSPYTMLEIGRLREFTFRNAGGGTGKEVDIDEFDTMDNPYKQLIIWDSKDEEIIGSYRFIEGWNINFDAAGKPLLSTTEIFNFSETFISKYLPTTIELGRSFVQPKYQSSRNGIFSLDNLWDGLGVLVHNNPQMEYFFGKISMYDSFNKEARDILLYFMNTYFPDKDKLVWPYNPIKSSLEKATLDKMFDGINKGDAYKFTTQKVRELGENIPPLFSAYIKLSPSMKTFGTAINNHFGGLEETGILIKNSEIYKTKLERHKPKF